MNEEEKNLIRKLSEKYPDRFRVGGVEDELEGIALDEDGFIDEGLKKIDIGVQDLRALLLHGRIQLADAGVELVLRKTADDEEFLKIKRVLQNNKGSGKVLVPVRWVNSRVAVILLEMLG
ncbi:hypothetical protein [Geoglobus ahangari]